MGILSKPMALWACACIMTGVWANNPGKPNVLLIIADQHHEAVMSNAGCSWVRTPGMDRLAENGVRFRNAYVSLPVCLPQRFSMFTGLLPHHRQGKEPKTDRTLGNLMKEAGYETAYFGKWHISGYDAIEDVDRHGFAICKGGKDQETVRNCVEFLSQKHDKPFFAVASFYNPHDICEWGRAKTGIKRDSTMKNGAQPITDPPTDACPPLPANFEINPDEAEAIGLRRRFGGPQAMASKWTPDEWRHYRWAYARLVQEVDTHVLALQETLARKNLETNTVVIYTSDHGDGIGAHRWHQKSVLYEESVRVPFIIQWKGHLPAGKVVDDLVSSGPDLMPTFCRLAGVDMPKGPYTGKSVMNILGESKQPNHDYVVCRVDYAYAGKEFTGRMLRSKDYKYMVFSSGDNREQLFDMREDGVERRNMAADKDCAKILDQHRAYFSEWRRASDDDYPKLPTPGKRSGGGEEE